MIIILMDRNGIILAHAVQTGRIVNACEKLAVRIPVGIVVKQVVTAPRQNSQQHVRVLRVLEDDPYKWMSGVTVGTMSTENKSFAALHR